MTKDNEAGKPSILLQEIVGVGWAVGEITLWLSGSIEARAKFRVRVENMAITRRVFWHKKQFRKIESDLYEIKWKADDQEWRALGFDFEGFFVMVLGCTHKNKVYDPPSWKSTAKRRIAEVKNGKWNRIPFEHVKPKEPDK
jgi:phage-related protein